jgi:magnesium chelatase family protein
VCDAADVSRYRSRISGPLLDRIDLHVTVPPVAFHQLTGDPGGETSARIRERVLGARERQRVRFCENPGVHANAQMGPTEIRRHCRVSPQVARLLQQALDRLRMSARAYHRILKVARTLADLEGSEVIRAEHAAEAIQYRALDRSRQ